MPGIVCAVRGGPASQLTIAKAITLAQERSARQGINAEGVVRQGSAGEELIGLCHELQADYLVLGKPKVEQEDTVSTGDRLGAFVERTEEQAGARSP